MSTYVIYASAADGGIYSTSPTYSTARAGAGLAAFTTNTNDDWCGQRHAHGKPGEPERGGVGQHVTGVGDERQRSRVDAADQLGEHCPGGEETRPEQPALVRISAAVIVAVIVAHVVP